MTFRQDSDGSHAAASKRPVPVLPSLPAPLPAILCFSHLRWDFVRQRPQHLMDRFAADRTVFVFEEPIPTDHHLAYYEIHPFQGTRVRAIRARIPRHWDATARETALRAMIADLVVALDLGRPVLWFYTPAMAPWAAQVDASAVVYDCMDELANFRFAPPQLVAQETALMARADVVFTGGYSLWEAKRDRHDNIHPFPSSVEAAHFARARAVMAEPADQAAIKGPKFGYYGVIDERLDLKLIDAVAKARPSYSFVFLGPLAKLSPADLPRRANLHYLGQKDYADLPAYLSGWAGALMPFAMNEATRFISPTKTPEYLAAGRAVIATPVRDVVRHYGDLNGVAICADAPAFAAACDAALALPPAGDWIAPADRALAAMSWDETQRRMAHLVDEAVARNAPPPLRPVPRSARTGPVGAPVPVGTRGASAPHDVLVVGAGFAGSVLAERLARDGGLRVLVCDRRPHVAGNAYDETDAAGVLIHRYGPHIFHTNSEDVFAYLSRFTPWRPYEHRVLALAEGKLVPMPINRTTLNALYDLNLASENEAAAFLATRAEPVDEIRSSRDVVVSAVGEHLYRTFFQGYTRKQWGLDPSDLDKSVTSRVPTRTSLDDRYFLDKFQAMPLNGYTRMFENMLDHDNITLALGTDFETARRAAPEAHVIFTGPVDEYFGHRFGRLPYRSLDFRFQTLDQRRFQPVAVVNYPDEAVPFTRITEYKYLTGQVHPKTTISYETARADGDPYYPIPRAENQELYRRYEALAMATPGVTFVGRLGTYRYYNMDQVVGQALATYRRLKPTLLAHAPETRAVTPGE